ncbi:hypothetical protein [Caballeronia catudaia]|uniref:hypothetical protein n=1 Tax=Caballeronia catudaia TaxID=1777136 RepID=UPI001F26E1F1|nr:hypothetical protein [Caballeronia catudaia]
MVQVFEEYAFPLKAAALQFVLGHPAIPTNIPGVRTVAQLDDNLQTFRTVIPAQSWVEPKRCELIRELLAVDGTRASMIVAPFPADHHDRIAEDHPGVDECGTARPTQSRKSRQLPKRCLQANMELATARGGRFQPIHEGNVHHGNWHGQVVQRRKGIRVHHAGRRRRRSFRALL